MDSPQAPALPSGFKSSEFSLSTLVALLGSAVAIGSLVVGTAQDSGLHLPPWVRLAGVGLGLAGAVIAKLGYTKSRTVLKVEQLRATVTPMLPQVLQAVNLVVDIARDIKAGGFIAPASGQTPATGTAGQFQQLAGAVQMVVPDSPLATAVTDVAEQLAGKVGDAAAARIQTDKQAVAELNEK